MMPHFLKNRKVVDLTKISVKALLRYHQENQRNWGKGDKELMIK